MTAKSQPYSTTDTAFAAYLSSIGAKLFLLDKESTPARFLFEHNNGFDFNNLELEWHIGASQGNIPAFLKAYRAFLHEINKRRS